jgi:hypothetical protein
LRLLKTLLWAAGIPDVFAAYSFRHALITCLFAREHSEVNAYTGHSNNSHTALSHYFHLDNRRLGREIALSGVKAMPEAAALLVIVIPCRPVGTWRINPDKEVWTADGQSVSGAGERHAVAFGSGYNVQTEQCDLAPAENAAMGRRNTGRFRGLLLQARADNLPVRPGTQ